MSPESGGGGGDGGARAQIWESFSGGARASVGGGADGCPSVRTGHRDGGRACGHTELPRGKSQVGDGVGVCPGAVQGGCSGRSGSVAPSLGVGAGRIDAPVAGGSLSSCFSRSGDSESLAAPQAWVVVSGGVLAAFAAGAVLGAVGSSGATVVGLPGSGDFRSKWISGLSVAGNLAAARACSHASGVVSIFRASAVEIRKRVAALAQAYPSWNRTSGGAAPDGGDWRDAPATSAPPTVSLEHALPDHLLVVEDRRVAGGPIRTDGFGGGDASPRSEQ